MSATYCTKCGTELIYSEYEGKRYDAYDGQPERYGQWSCPNLKCRRLLGPNGHTWTTHRISSLSRHAPHPIEGGGPATMTGGAQAQPPTKDR